jgi:hypothetical protein
MNFALLTSAKLCRARSFKVGDAASPAGTLNPRVLCRISRLSEVHISTAPQSKTFGELVKGDAPVAFIYSASSVGMQRSALGPDGIPRTFTSIKS